jgi:hypothetical protein
MQDTPPQNCNYFRIAYSYYSCFINITNREPTGPTFPELKGNYFLLRNIYPDYLYVIQEVLRRTNRLLVFDNTGTARKPRKN